MYARYVLKIVKGPYEPIFNTNELQCKYLSAQTREEKII